MQTAEPRNHAMAQTTGPLADHGIDPNIYARRWKTLAALCLALLIIILIPIFYIVPGLARSDAHPD